MVIDRGNERETQVDRLDTIAIEDEESRRESRRRSQSKGKREEDYDVNGTRNRRKRCWSRINKIVPAVLPTVSEVPSGAEGARHEQGTTTEIFEDKPVEASNDHVFLAFSETKDSFLQRQNGALALQSFATCARLNENFMRSTPWKPADVKCDDGNVSETQPTTTNSSFSTKISSAWKDFRRSISRRESRVTEENEACSSNENTSKARENVGDSTEVKCKPQRKVTKKSGKYFKRKPKRNSSKVTNNEPVGIQEPAGNDSTFDRDLYMNVNNLVVPHESCDYVCRDPFLFPEEIPTLSGLPLEYLDCGLRSKNDVSKSTKRKSRLSGFLGRFKRK